MASTAIVAKRMDETYRRAAEVIVEHGSEESREGLAWLSPNGNPPSLNRAPELAAYQAEMIAGLAELVAAQQERIEKLEKASKKK